jgi:hypothetical protein
MRQTWIFQGNPSSFDVDAFFRLKPATFLWQTNRLRERLQVGDQVFIWRAVGGGDKETSGIIAEAETIDVPKRQEDAPDAAMFWREQKSHSLAQGTAKFQVRLRSLHFADAKSTLKRDWLRADPVLKDLTIIKNAIGTNFLVAAEHAARLNSLWLRVGKDWNYPESVAGLWAYKNTIGKEVSQAPGSIVAETALRIGRVVSGVYNKVMNFRSIDPNDPRKGFTGAGQVDRKVWAKFYDPTLPGLRDSLLDAEFERLWGSGYPFVGAEVEIPKDRSMTQEATELESLPLELLWKRYQEGTTHLNRSPRTLPTTTLRFERNLAVIALAKVRANFHCEIANCSSDTFNGENGRPYCEVHHINWLSEGGNDTPQNVACLCPRHHREIHFGRTGHLLTVELTLLRSSESGMSHTI